MNKTTYDKRPLRSNAIASVQIARILLKAGFVEWRNMGEDGQVRITDDGMDALFLLKRLVREESN